MRLKISIKYKLLFLLLILPLATLGLYFWMAKDLFQKDKLAYIYSANLQTAKSLQGQLEGEINLLRSIAGPLLLGLDVDNGKFNIVSQNILHTLPQIQAVNIFSVDGQGWKKIAQMAQENFPGPLASKLENAFNTYLEKRIDYESFLAVVDEEAFLFNLIIKTTSPDNRPFYVSMTFTSKNLFGQMKEDNIFTNYLVGMNGELLLKGQNSVKLPIEQFLETNDFQKIVTGWGSEGTFDYTTLAGNRFICSFVKIGSSMALLSFLDKDLALAPVNQLIYKSGFFLLALLSLASIIAVYASTSMTHALRILHRGALDLSQGNFEIAVEVDTRDELEDFALAFVLMSEKIKQLLMELRTYSENLEQMVVARTRELNEALNLQKAMVDSLSQGFFVFDGDGKILDVYSKAAVEMFSELGPNKFLWDVLQRPDGEIEELKIFCQQMILEMLPLEDLLPLAPKVYVSSKQRQISIEYAPIRNNEKLITGIVLIATDKTDELLSQQRIEKEANLAKMITKITTQKEQFRFFIQEVQNLVEELKKYFGNQQFTRADANIIYRLMHTLKGQCGLFHLSDLQNMLHQCEENLLVYYKSEQVMFDSELIHSNIRQIEESFVQFIAQNAHILGFASWGEVQNTKEVQVEELKGFYQQLQAIDRPLALQFYQHLYTTPIENYLRPFQGIVDDLAYNRGKKVAPLQIDGGKLKILAEDLQQLFASFVHLFRNSLDHGIETPEERLLVNKEEAGKISIKVEAATINQHAYLLINYQDDGKGINPELIREKLRQQNRQADANKSDSEVIYHILDPNFSTNEQVNNISGRGVGMDAVAKIIEDLGGQLEIHTIKGHGVKFKMLIPHQVV